MNLTLVVLAAGKGRRFGGPKQLTPVGAQGETITHYNVYNAMRAGFSQVVFVVRQSIADDLREALANPLSKQIEVQMVCQDGGHDARHDGAGGQGHPVGLWGTTHAVLAARDKVTGPFAVINADDYYGPGAFRLLSAFFEQDPEGQEHALLGYAVTSTLSSHGPVTRALCSVEPQGHLSELRELVGVEAEGSRVCYQQSDGSRAALPEHAVVSMNCWGLRPPVFDGLNEAMEQFYEQLGEGEGPSECLLPEVMGDLVRQRRERVRVLPTTDQWFGLTYAQDLESAREAVADLTRRGRYPSPLFEAQTP